MRLIKAFELLVVILFISGCATSYQPSGYSGGFTEKQLNSATFHVGFAGNGYTNGSRAYDFALTRAAELCLNNGFNYMALLSENNSVDSSSSIQTVNYIPTGYGAVGIGNSTLIAKPRTSITSQCFVKEPRGIEATEVITIIDSVKQKYNLDNEFVKGSFDYDTFERDGIEFMRKNPISPIDTPSREGEPLIIFNEKDFRPGFLMKVKVRNIDQPYVDREMLKNYGKRIAEELNCDVIIINDELSVLGNSKVSGKFIPSLAIYGGVRKASIGVVWEPALAEQNIYDVRRFINKTKAQESGLEYGDRIISIDDVDTLNPQAFNYEKAHGEIVKLEVVRGGKKLYINVPLTDLWTTE